jgi:perosamine synthetase
MTSTIQQLSLLQSKTLKDALSQINDNAMGICFVVDESGCLTGIITDGDVRRALLNNIGIDEPVITAMNRNFFHLPVETDNAEILKYLSDEIKIIPLLDQSGRLVDYATFNKIRRIAVAAPLLSGNELAYVTDCIVSNWISSQGRYVRLFEQMFSEYHLGLPALAVSNGTVALHLALEALGIKKGDEVIVPDLTFAASINSIIYTGATPVLAEVDKITWNIDTGMLEALVTPNTKAIMVVHLYGLPCDMDAILAFANKHNLLIIEDCAEALGSLYNGNPVGIFGDASTFSFYGNKTITTGEGGMVIFKDAEKAGRAEVLRDHGMNKKRRYWHDEVGYNYRMTNIQAAIGVAQFERLHEFVGTKRKIAEAYNNCLGQTGFFVLPHQQEGYVNSHWLYTALVNEHAPFDRDEVIAYLNLQGVESRPVFYPLHEMDVYKGYTRGTYPNSQDISKRGISLPSSSSLSESDLQWVCNTLAAFCKKFELPIPVNV